MVTLLWSIIIVVTLLLIGDLTIGRRRHTRRIREQLKQEFAQEARRAAREAEGGLDWRGHRKGQSTLGMPWEFLTPEEQEARMRDPENN